MPLETASGPGIEHIRALQEIAGGAEPQGVTRDPATTRAFPRALPRSL